MRSAILPGVMLALSAVALPAQGTVTIGRLHYDGGGDWYANPSSLPNLIAAASRDTGIPLAPRERVIRLSDPALWEVGYLHLTGHGEIRFPETDLTTLRRWLIGGGFLHADDNYGLDQSFRREMARLFPDRPLVEVPLDHPIYWVVHRFPDGLPKIHEHDDLPPQGFGIFIDGRLAVFYSYQTDLGDGWEDEGVHDDPPAIREAALRMGTNLIAYALGWGG